MDWLRRQQSLFLFLLLAFPFFWRLDAEEFHGDESHWISSGQQAFYLLTTGRLTDPQWRAEFYLYSQPQVGKLLVGAALAGAGIAGPTPIYDYDWQRRPWENRARGRIPSPAAVHAGRVAGAIAGWVGCLALWGLARELGVVAAGPLGATLLASHPLWLANARRAGLDAPALALGLVAAWLALRALSRISRGDRARGAALRPALLAGATLGLGVGAKYVAPLMVPVVAIPLGAALYAADRGSRRHLLGATALALLVAGGTFWVANPTLYAHPLQGIRASVDFLTWQAGEMRQRSPVFQSPPLVALEIIDRAFWPTRFPPVIDLTLPEPLVPGSYGTPVVALGALAATVALLLRGRSALDGRRPTTLPLLAAVSWAVAVALVLTLSVPIWWERWHLPLIPPLCLLAGIGLERLSRLPPGAPASGRGRVPLGPLLVGAQCVSALALGPSYLGNGFGALINTPVGALAHLLALTFVLGTLAVHYPGRTQRHRRQRVPVP